MTPEVWEAKAKISYWNFIKNLLHREGNKKIKVNLCNRRKYFQITYLVKGYYPKHIKTYQTQQQKNPINNTVKKKKWVEDIWTFFQRRHPNG